MAKGTCIDAHNAETRPSAASVQKVKSGYIRIPRRVIPFGLAAIELGRSRLQHFAPFGARATARLAQLRGNKKRVSKKLN